MSKMIGSTGASSADQWNSNAQMNNPAKDMQMTQGKQSGWEEPSPPSQRRNIPSTFADAHAAVREFAEYANVRGLIDHCFVS